MVSDPHEYTLDEDETSYIDRQLKDARELHMVGEYEEAIKVYQSICKKYPFVHQAWGNMGTALAALGRKEEAIKTLERAVQVRPDYELAKRNLEEIKRATPEQLKQPGFISGKAGLLDIGIMQYAIDAWMDVLVGEDLQSIRALHDVDAWLPWFEEKSVRVDENGFFDIETVCQLNNLLVEPDVGEQIFNAFKGTQDVKPFTFDKESQFPSVWRLHRLFETAGLAQHKERRFVLTESVSDFRRASRAEKYAGLLWRYLVDVSWADMEKVARPNSELGELDQIQQDMVDTIQRIASRRVDQLLNASGREREWIDPIENLPFSNTNGEEQVDVTAALEMFYRANEEKYLWQPLAWFGLVEVTLKPWFGGLMPVMESVRPTLLGVRLLPTMTHADSSVDDFSLPSVGRNDPCPCGAKRPDGRPMKYKKCHGR